MHSSISIIYNITVLYIPYIYIYIPIYLSHLLHNLFLFSRNLQLAAKEKKRQKRCVKSALKNLWKLFLINSQWFVCVCVCFLQLLCGFYCCCWPLHRTCRLGCLCFFRFAKCYWPKLRKSTRKSTTKKNKIKEEKTRKGNAHMLVKSHCK